MSSDRPKSLLQEEISATTKVSILYILYDECTGYRVSFSVYNDNIHKSLTRFTENLNHEHPIQENRPTGYRGAGTGRGRRSHVGGRGHVHTELRAV